METKLNKLILGICLFSGLSVYAQKEASITNVKIDTLIMKGMLFDYSKCFSNCNYLKDDTSWNEDIETKERKILLSCDSILLHQRGYFSPNVIYTYFIQILSAKHIVYYHGNAFKVGMSIEDVGYFLPKIQEEYSHYSERKEKKFYESAYFGLPLLDDTDDEVVNIAGLKFEILEGKIISILVDFRADGDFD